MQFCLHNCSKYGSDSISEDLILKFFLGGMSPDPPKYCGVSSAAFLATRNYSTFVQEPPLQDTYMQKHCLHSPILPDQMGQVKATILLGIPHSNWVLIK